MQRAEADIAQAQDNAQKGLDAYQGSIVKDDDRQNFNSLKDEWQKYTAMWDTLRPLSPEQQHQGVCGPDGWPHARPVQPGRSRGEHHGRLEQEVRRR